MSPRYKIHRIGLGYIWLEKEGRDLMYQDCYNTNKGICLIMNLEITTYKGR